jgi:co-chaperonin GroES (HSP10)
MKAINYNIVIEKIKEKPQKIAGLEITEKLDSDNRYLKARVISAGHKVECIQDGDIIYYDKNNGHGITWNGNMYHVISIGNVVLVE